MDTCFRIANRYISNSGNQKINSKLINLYFNTCKLKPNNDCELSQEGKKYLSGSSISVQVAGKYVNLNNYDDPIQQYFEELDNQILNPQAFHSNFVSIERQEATFEDSIWFYLFPPNPVKFNKISDKHKIVKENANFYGTEKIFFPHYLMSFSLGSEIFQFR